MENNFNPFVVDEDNDKYVFLLTNLGDIAKTAEDCFRYFFSPQTLFSYFKALEDNPIFEPNEENNAALYRNLSYFFDKGAAIPSRDKYGKIGEYFLSILLLKHFGFRCVLPKLIIISDNKMPVYGIDTLFYSEDHDLLLLGEAKFSLDLDAGIHLINMSLAEYDKQFDDEFRLLVSNNAFRKSPNPKIREFGKEAGSSISFASFVKRSGIVEIGVPLFVCHGTETNPNDIKTKLDKINTPPSIAGLKVKYWVISMPVSEKDKFGMEIVSLIKMEADKYGG